MLPPPSPPRLRVSDSDFIFFTLSQRKEAVLFLFCVGLKSGRKHVIVALLQQNTATSLKIKCSFTGEKLLLTCSALSLILLFFVGVWLKFIFRIIMLLWFCYSFAIQVFFVNEVDRLASIDLYLCVYIADFYFIF